MIKAALRSGNLVTVVAKGQRASGPASLLIYGSQYWDQVAFGNLEWAPITKPDSAHISGPFLILLSLTSS